MKQVTLHYHAQPVQADKEAWFNATRIAAMFGKQPHEWLRLPESAQYIAALIKREEEKRAASNTGLSRITKSHFIKTKRGNNGGTWLHPKLAVVFARWCDIDFAVWCDEQIEALLTNGRRWNAAREESRIGYRVMSEILQAARQADGKDTKPYHYSNEALLCNAALTGQFRAIERDKLDEKGITLLARLEARNAVLIGSGIPYQKRKECLFDLAARYRQQAALRRNLVT